MKRHIHSWSTGLAVMMALPLFGGRGVSANAADAPGYGPPPVTMGNPPVTTTQNTAVPSNIDPNSPLAEVIKLAQAGVGESVIQSYIANSPAPFSLDSDEIIYLRDLGLSDATVNAMLQRDQALGASAPVATTPPPQPQPPTVTAPATPPAQNLPADETYFYDSLSPYGNWVDVEGVGQCWQPTVVYVNSGWQPYCDGGHWVYTDCGWYWTSDYSWGWAPFHYGRWFHDTHRGWCWSPDREWGPAWVTWRYNDNYCGWAPLPPGAGFRAGGGFTFHGRGVDANFGFGIGADFFTFVSVGNFTDRHPWQHRVDRGDRTRIYNSTTVINNIVVGNNNTIINNGFGHQRIETATHTTLKPIHVAENSDHNPSGERHERFEGGNLVVNRPPLNEHADNKGHVIPHFDTPPRNLPGNNNNNNNDHGVGNGNEHAGVDNRGNNGTGNGTTHGNNPFINGGNAGSNPRNGSSPFTPANNDNGTHVSTPVTSGGTPTGNGNGSDNRHRTVFDHDSGPKVTTPSTPTTTPSTHVTAPSTHVTAPSSSNPFINSGNNGGNNFNNNNSGPIDGRENSHLRDNSGPHYSPKIESTYTPPRHTAVEPTFPRNNPTVVAPSGGQPSHTDGGNGNGGGGNRGGNNGGGGNGNGNANHSGGNGGGNSGGGNGDKKNH